MSVTSSISELNLATAAINREAEILRWKNKYQELQQEFEKFRRKMENRKCPECERRKAQTRIRVAKTRRKQKRNAR